MSAVSRCTLYSVFLNGVFTEARLRSEALSDGQVRTDRGLIYGHALNLDWLSGQTVHPVVAARCCFQLSLPAVVGVVAASLVSLPPICCKFACRCSRCHCPLPTCYSCCCPAVVAAVVFRTFVMNWKQTERFDFLSNCPEAISSCSNHPGIFGIQCLVQRTCADRVRINQIWHFRWQSEKKSSLDQVHPNPGRSSHTPNTEAFRKQLSYKSSASRPLPASSIKAPPFNCAPPDGRPRLSIANPTAYIIVFGFCRAFRARGLS